MQIYRFGYTFGAAVLLLAGQRALAQHYTIDDLGTLTNRSSAATGLSTTGYVVGFSSVSGNNNGEPWFNHAFRWYNGVMTDLGVLGQDVPPGQFPKPESMAQGVNSLGQVVGKSVQPFERYKGFLWLPSPAYGFPAGINALPELPGGATIANQINDAGWIVGESRYAGSIGARPVLWRYDGTQWTITDLGDLGGPYGRAEAINQKGEAVGQANAANGRMHSFLWLPQPDYGLDAGMHDILPSIDDTWAAGLNEKGQVVGWIGGGAPYLWLPAPDYGLPAGVTILSMNGIPDAAGAWPAAITDDGVIVGQLAQRFYMDPPGIWVTRYGAMIWRSGQMLKLGDLLPPNSGWTLTAAAGIIDNGQICGFGISPAAPDQGHAFRLTPQHVGDLNCDGVVNFGDIDPFVLALTGYDAYHAQYPNCNWLNADVNGDGRVDFSDIDPFVALLGGG